MIKKSMAAMASATSMVVVGVMALRNMFLLKREGFIKFVFRIDARDLSGSPGLEAFLDGKAQTC